MVGFHPLANDTAFDALPREIQGVVEGNAEKFALLQRDDIEEVNAGGAEELARKGMKINTADTDSFRAKLGDFYARWRTKAGATAWAGDSDDPHIEGTQRGRMRRDGHIRQQRPAVANRGDVRRRTPDFDDHPIGDGTRSQGTCNRSSRSGVQRLGRRFTKAGQAGRPSVAAHGPATPSLASAGRHPRQHAAPTGRNPSEVDEPTLDSARLNAGASSRTGRRPAYGRGGRGVIIIVVAMGHVGPARPHR